MSNNNCVVERVKKVPLRPICIHGADCKSLKHIVEVHDDNYDECLFDLCTAHFHAYKFRHEIDDLPKSLLRDLLDEPEQRECQFRYPKGIRDFYGAKLTLTNCPNTFRPNFGKEIYCLDHLNYFLRKKFNKKQ